MKKAPEEALFSWMRPDGPHRQHGSTLVGALAWVLLLRVCEPRSRLIFWPRPVVMV
jgi:hypothetical protein